MSGSTRAFPLAFDNMQATNIDWGLTKRELFAAMAKQGYLAGRNIDNRDTAREVAMLRCVQYADDLIEALDGTAPKGGA